MRLVHLSDPHFGREDRRVVAALLDDLAALRPDLIALSGDLTQRARRSEFAAARTFIRDLPAPAVVVAGNHDMPAFELHERFIDPDRRYRCELASELQPRVEVDGSWRSV